MHSSAAVTADHVEELPEHIERDVKLSRAAAGEQRGDGEAGADGGEVVVRVHCTAVGEVGAWRGKQDYLKPRGMIPEGLTGSDELTFKILSSGVSRRAGGQTGPLWAGLRMKEG